MASDIFAKIGTSRRIARREAQGRSRSCCRSPGREQRRLMGTERCGEASDFQDVTFVHMVDKASPVLMQACATATISRRRRSRTARPARAAGVPHREDERRHRHGRRARRSGDSGQSENVSLAFAKVSLEYKPRSRRSLDAGIFFKYD